MICPKVHTNQTLLSNTKAKLQTKIQSIPDDPQWKYFTLAAAMSIIPNDNSVIRGAHSGSCVLSLCNVHSHCKLFSVQQRYCFELQQQVPGRRLSPLLHFHIGLANLSFYASEADMMSRSSGSRVGNLFASCSPLLHLTC